MYSIKLKHRAGETKKQSLIKQRNKVESNKEKKKQNWMKDKVDL